MVQFLEQHLVEIIILVVVAVAAVTDHLELF